MKKTGSSSGNQSALSTSGGGGNRRLFGAAPAGDSEILARAEAEADVERRRLLAEQQARVRAARRGGYRALLSQERLTPETGLQTTLGPS